MDDGIARPRVIVVENDEDNLESVTILLGRKYEVFGYRSCTCVLITSTRDELR
jgi:hypothetical protein